MCVKIGMLADSSPIELVDSRYKLANLCFLELREPYRLRLLEVPLPFIDLSLLRFISDKFLAVVSL